MPDDGQDQEWMFTSHPDLVDEQWAKKAAKAARKQARRDRRHRPPAPRSDDPRGPRRGPLMRVSVILAVLIGVLVLVENHPWSRSASPVRQAAVIPPTVTPAKRQVALLNLAQPFATTPAASWSDGEAGIQPPPAAPLGHYTAAQVAAATAQVKQILVVAHLDPRVLVNHDPSGYLALLSVTGRGYEQGVLSGQKYGANGGGAVTLLANGFHLLPVPVKVNGTMTVALGQGGTLTVHTNYVFAYPFAPADPNRITQAWQIVAVEHVTQDFQYIADKQRYAANDQGVNLGDEQAYFADMACAPSKQGILAPAYSDPAYGNPGNENPDALFDPNHTMNITDTCG